MLNELVKSDKPISRNEIKNVETESFCDHNSYSVSNIEDLMNLRSLLVKKIAGVISYQNWNQKYAANILNIDQPKISQIKNSKIEGFSLERLLKFFVLLGWKIELKLTK